MVSFNVWVRQKIDTLERQVRSLIELVPYVSRLVKIARRHTEVFYNDHAIIYNTAARWIANVTWSSYDMYSEDYDAHGIHGAASSPLTIQRPGLYSIDVFQAWNTNLSGYRLCRILVNGGYPNPFNYYHTIQGSGTYYFGFQHTFKVRLSQGDTVDIQNYTNGGNDYIRKGSVQVTRLSDLKQGDY